MKKVSKIKVGLCALLGYFILNVIRNVVFAIIGVFISGFNSSFIRYRLEEIAFFFAFYIGFNVSTLVGRKLLKTEDVLRRYNGTIGILFIINYVYYIVDYFIYNEGKLFYLISSLFIGIILLFNNRKKDVDKEKEE